MNPVIQKTEVGNKVTNIAATYFLAKQVIQKGGEETEEHKNKRTQCEERLPAHTAVLLSFVDVEMSPTGGYVKHKSVIISYVCIFMNHI